MCAKNFEDKTWCILHIFWCWSCMVVSKTLYTCLFPSVFVNKKDLFLQTKIPSRKVANVYATRFERQNKLLCERELSFLI